MVTTTSARERERTAKLQKRLQKIEQIIATSTDLVDIKTRVKALSPVEPPPDKVI